MKPAPYPEPPVKYEGFSDLHFATESQITSPFSLGGFDRGELTLRPNRLVFRGMQWLVDCPAVTSVKLVGKAFPWPLIVAVGVAASVLARWQAPGHFTLNKPLPYILLGILGVASALQWREEWIEILYSEGGRIRRAYYQRRSTFGFGSSRGRTRALLREIRRTVLRDETTPPP